MLLSRSPKKAVMSGGCRVRGGGPDHITVGLSKKLPRIKKKKGQPPGAELLKGVLYLVPSGIPVYLVLRFTQ